MNFGLTEKHLNSITDALKLHPDSDQTDHPSTPYSFYTPHAPAASAPPTYPYNPRPRHNLPADNSSGPQHKQDTAACHQTAKSSPKQPYAPNYHRNRNHTVTYPFPFSEKHSV